MANDGQPRPSEPITVHIDPELADLIPGFLENRRKDVTVMLGALQQGDYKTVRVLGHSMKGAGGGYGFDAITDIGAALEQAAKDNNAEAIRKWVGELSAYLDRVEVVYD